jgi:hypothetical protein
MSDVTDNMSKLNNCVGRFMREQGVATVTGMHLHTYFMSTSNKLFGTQTSYLASHTVPRHVLCSTGLSAASRSVSHSQISHSIFPLTAAIVRPRLDAAPP